MPYAHLFSIVAMHIQDVVTQGGYTLLFFITLLESIPLLGMVVPGHISIIIAGFLSSVGIMNIWIVLGLSILGVILGDLIAFTLGRRYGLTFITRLRPYFFITDNHIEKAKSLLSKHTGKAIIIGRFNPVTRALIPFLVGSSPVKQVRFWFWNIIGAVSWALSSIMVGYIFGSSYHIVSGYIGKFVFIAFIATLVIIWGYRFINIRFHIFARFELFALGLNLVSLWALAKTIQDAWSAHSFMANFDIWVNIFMADHVSPLLVSFASWISLIGGTTIIVIVSLLGIIFLIYKKRWQSNAILVLSVGSTGIILGLMKEFFLRERPLNALETIVNDPSFPSGHAGMAAVFFTVLVYLCIPYIHSLVKRELFIVFSIIAMIAIGASRLVLNVHWTSDVVAGWSLGIFCATASILLVKYIGVLVSKKTKIRS